MNTSPDTLSLSARLLDALVIGLCGFAAYAWRFGFTLPSPDYLGLIVIGVLLALLFFPLFGLYRSWRGGLLIDLAGRVTLAWGMVFLTLALMLFAFRLGMGYSRIWVFLWGGLSAGGLIVLRIVTYGVLHQMRRRGLNQKRIALIGEGAAADEILRRTDEAHWAGYRIEAHFSADEVETSTALQHLDQLVTILHQHAIDEVWIALPLRDEARIQHILMLLRHEPISVRYAPDISSLRLLNHDISTILGLPMLDLRATPMQGINLWLKAIEDTLLASLILLLVSPLMLLIALGIKLTSPGPVLFRQQRHGWGGRAIEVYKFRSMHLHDAAPNQVQQATRSDTRITPFGAFLRRTSLDELPQFINVLQGRMSIVGPRPHALAHNEHYKELIDSYMLRHKVKPGITGWAQVNGYRGETDTLEKMQKRIEYDLYYIEHWSLGLDLKIIALTLFKGFSHPNAY
jgi:putative colanic acid biosynthesis UDP-glucose lipid carrier transferase